MRRSFHRDSGDTPVAQRQDLRQPVAPPRAPCTCGRVRLASCPRLPCWGLLDMAEAACRRTSRAECRTPCKTCRRRLLSRRSCCKTPSTPRALPRRPSQLKSLQLRQLQHSSESCKKKQKPCPVTRCLVRYKCINCLGKPDSLPTDRKASQTMRSSVLLMALAGSAQAFSLTTVPSLRVPRPSACAVRMGKEAADGIFTPAVKAAKVVLGDKKLNAIRGDVIAMHSKVFRENMPV